MITIVKNGSVVKTFGERKKTPLVLKATGPQEVYARWVEVLSANQDGSAELKKALSVAKQALA